MILNELLDLFFASHDALGKIARVSPEELPSPYGSLLDHDDHMTVTMEAYHSSLVDVRVLETRPTDHSYARKILLTRQADGRPVLFGLVRLKWCYLTAAVRNEIESRRIPLGRVLIKHNLMRHIQLLNLWRIDPSPELAEYLGTDQPVYGRTAIIYVNQEPAIELLEIVTSCQ